MWKCHKCGKPVYFAERKQSLGYYWHPECLRCEECQKRLNPGQHAEHKGVPYCHVPCYGALFGPQLFGHGTRVESHTSFGKVENRSYSNTPRSHLEQKLKAFNAFYDGKNGKSCEIRSREVNGRLVLEGALRIYWGVFGMIHLKEDDDQRTVVTVRKRNSSRFSGKDDNDSDIESSVPEQLTLDQTDIIKGELTPEMKKNLIPSNTLPSKLNASTCGDWDEVDELLQVERQIDDKQKLYQTMPAGVLLKPFDSNSDDTLVSEKSKNSEENCLANDSCLDYEKTLVPESKTNESNVTTPESDSSNNTDSDTYSCNFERSVEGSTLTRSISGPESYNFDQVHEDYENLSLKIKSMLRSLSTPEDLKNGLDRTDSFNYSESSYPMGNFPYDDSLKRYLNASYHQTSSDPSIDPPIILRKPKGSTAIKRRTGKRRSRTKLKRRCSINGHFYNRETSFFRPPHGSQMSVWVTSLVSTGEVINNLLEKYKVDSQPDNFALFVVRDNGEQRRLKEDEYPLLVRVMLGPHEDVAKLFLMDAHNTEEISSDVAQFLNLSIAECQNILDRYEDEEERQAKRIRLKFRELKKRIKERMEELKVAGKREPEQEREAQEWIEQVVGERFPPGVPYEDVLRDGIFLCKLMNKLQPGIISKINISGGDYKFMDNLSQFQKACVKYGVPDVDLFQTVDLWDKKNIAQVTMTIFAIGRTAYKHPEWRGPYLGPRPSEEHRREWTEEQLRAGEAIIGLQAGTNKGANQSGQNFGATRKILLGK